MFHETEDIYYTANVGDSRVGSSANSPSTRRLLDGVVVVNTRLTG